MDIVKKNIDTIKPYWRNPRKNGEKAVKAVKDSIKKYGYNQPIVIDKDNVIIAGHTRYKAIRELGYKDVPVVVLDISEDKAKQYRIADNKAAEKSEWDDDLLMFELREIDELEDMQDFFDNGELDVLLDIRDEEYTFDDFDEEEERKQATATVMATVKQDEPVDEEELEEKVQQEVMDRFKDSRAEENERIKKREQELQERFKNQSKEKENDYIDVSCPYCEEQYTLSKAQLLRGHKTQNV